jgi:sugar lactone lactonase YvrE
VKLLPGRLARVTVSLAAAAALGSVLVVSNAGGVTGPDGDAVPTLPADASFTTIFPAPLSVEGLTGDRHGNLYSAGRNGDPCPVWRLPSTGGDAVVVGNIPAPCSPAGIALDARGRIYVANNGAVHVFVPDPRTPPTSTVFAADVPGANGLAFDRAGALWVSDGTTGQGRVWKVGRDGEPVEMFRVQPMVNEVNVVDGVGGIGRDPRSLPPGAVTVAPTGRAAADTAGSQHLVANGLAFTRDGSLVVADTARGAIWRVEFDRRGAVRNELGCDTTFAANTLCLNDIVVAHPLLDGADGIVLDRAGNIWVAVNERNAVVVVTARGTVVEAFRNAPDAATRLRNDGPMEFPTSPFIADRRLCLAHSDGSRRDNFPNTGGEASPNGPVLAKISCLDQRLPSPGVPLPVS